METAMRSERVCEIVSTLNSQVCVMLSEVANREACNGVEGPTSVLEIYAAHGKSRSFDSSRHSRADFRSG